MWEVSWWQRDVVHRVVVAEVVGEVVVGWGYLTVVDMRSGGDVLGGDVLECGVRVLVVVVVG